jgi:predicted phage tail protein
MRNIFLYGDLAEKFGEKWTLEVASVGEAVRAIHANTGNFYQAIRQGSFAIVRGKDLKSGSGLEIEDLGLEFGSGDFHICPVAAGGSLLDIFTTIAGVLIVALAVIYQQYWAVPGGLALIAGGVTRMLSPVPETGSDGSAGKTSFIFTGPQNISEQGRAVPLVYGGLNQPVFVGSVVISQGIQSIDANG